MSKQTYITRYLWLIQFLCKKKGKSYEEILNHFEYKNSCLEDTDVQKVSKRTLQRDIRDIKNIYGIDIEHNRGMGGYYISNDEKNKDSTNRILEALEVMNMMRISKNNKPYIFFDSRKPAGLENLNGFLHAIKNHLITSFDHYKFEEDEYIRRKIEPYALKEAKSRWYVIAKDCRDNYVKTFALDRISNLEISPDKFSPANLDSIIKRFDHSFGIIAPSENEAPVDVLLAFTPYQAKYIKSFPLHQSQQVIKENEKECQIKLHVYITHDFVMELLSMGENVKVLKPASLIKEIKRVYEVARGQYENK